MGDSSLLPTIIVVIASTVAFASAEDAERQNVTMWGGAFNHGKCERQGSYTHDMTSLTSHETIRYYPLHETWEERCRNCSCNAMGAFCTGPFCLIPYDFTMDEWCTRWSEDGCCCEEIGCTIDGVTYQSGAEYPYGRGNPCLKCPCGIGMSREYCLSNKCGTYEVPCDDAEVTYDDNCCPHYQCPQSGPCDTIPDPFPLTPRHELLDWYGGHLDPIPLGMTQYFHLDSWNSYVCTCKGGTTATCKMETFSG